MSATDDADRFAAAFRAVYLTFHRRDGRTRQLSNASRAMLVHLSQTGPLTIGEAARHLDRAQSVISDMVTQLESHQLLAREPDPSNRRRTLVWLTPEGLAAVAADADVLDRDRLALALAGLSAPARAELIALLETLTAPPPAALGNSAAPHPHEEDPTSIGGTNVQHQV